GKKFRMHAGATYMDVFTEGSGVRSDQYFAPEWSGTFNASYEPRSRTSIDLTGQWYGPMRLPVLPNDFRPERSPLYGLIDLQLKHRIGKFELYGGVKNLLDFVPRDPL